MSRMNWSPARTRAIVLNTVERALGEGVSARTRITLPDWEEVARMLQDHFPEITPAAVRQGFYQHISPKRVDDLLPLGFAVTECMLRLTRMPEITRDQVEGWLNEALVNLPVYLCAGSECVSLRDAWEAVKAAVRFASPEQVRFDFEEPEVAEEQAIVEAWEEEEVPVIEETQEEPEEPEQTPEEPKDRESVRVFINQYGALCKFTVGQADSSISMLCAHKDGLCGIHCPLLLVDNVNHVATVCCGCVTLGYKLEVMN